MDHSRYIIWLGDCNDSHHALVGGKSTGLGAMLRRGNPVPPGFAVTTEAYQAALTLNDLQPVIDSVLRPLRLEDTDAIEDASTRIRSLIESAPVPVEVDEEVRSAYHELCESCASGSSSSEVPVAVRSSATAEDLPGASFAGQQDTFLWVIGTNEVTDYLRMCWSSLYTARAIAYRMEMGFDHDRVLMSACVQKMVNARTAGVMFTLNPANGDRSKIAIDASWGLGEAVAAGEVTPDNYLVDKITLELVRKTVSAKEVEYRPDLEGRSVEKLKVESPRRDEPCLSESEAVALARHARSLEKEAGYPLDLEWAIDADLPEGENLVLLQSRPETVWSRRPRESVTEGGLSTMDHIITTLLTGVRVRSGTEG